MKARLRILYAFLFCSVPGISQIILPPTPQPVGYQSVDGNTHNANPNTPIYQQIGKPVFMGATAHDITNQQNNRTATIFDDSSQKLNELQQLKRELAKDNRRYPQPKIPGDEKSYYDAFNALNDIAASNNFSLAEATYIVENAHFNNKLSRENFYKALLSRAELCKQILKREHLPANNNLAKNYVIQKLYQQDNSYYDSKLKRKVTIPQMKYDFDDWNGDSSYTKLTVTKLIATGMGQCHSMPLLYLLIADQLGTKAYLSTAPEHSFIRFPDTAGHLYNFEATSGVLVTDNFMTASSYINSTAIKNKIYLDTLTSKQLLALCYIDLANEYVSRFTYKPFVEQLAQKAVLLYPNCIQAHMLLSMIEEVKLEYYGQRLGCQKLEDIPKHPELKAFYDERQRQYDIIDGLGYQQMPKEAYTSWLNSVAEEKRKQESSQMAQQIKYQLKFSKIKTTSSQN